MKRQSAHEYVCVCECVLVAWVLADGGQGRRAESKQQMGKRDELIVWVLKAISCWHCKQLKGNCFVMSKVLDGMIRKTGLSLHEIRKHTQLSCSKAQFIVFIILKSMRKVCNLKKKVEKPFKY